MGSILEVSTRDSHGRGPYPRPVTAAFFILAIPDAPQQFRPVPSEHIFGEHVQCVCGANHELREVGELYREPCCRWFIRTPDAVLCYREPDGWQDADMVDVGGEISGEPPGWYVEPDGELVRVTA